MIIMLNFECRRVVDISHWHSSPSCLTWWWCTMYKLCKNKIISCSVHHHFVRIYYISNQRSISSKMAFLHLRRFNSQTRVLLDENDDVQSRRLHTTYNKPSPCLKSETQSRWRISCVIIIVIILSLWISWW